MLILKNVTAVQLHPAKVQEGVDIAIENAAKASSTTYHRS